MIQRRLMVIVFIVLGLMALGTTAQARPFNHPFGELREYHRHWLAVCPNIHKPESQSEYETNCWASTWTGNEDGTFTGDFPGYRLSVHRNRKSGTLSITFVSASVEKIDKSRDISVRFSDGRVKRFPYGSRVTTNRNSGNEYMFSDNTDTSDLVRRMKAGNHVTITMPTKEGELSMFFSTQGLTSALLFLKKYAGQ